MTMIATFAYGQFFYSPLSKHDYYVYNNSKDTLFLTEIDVGEWTPVKSNKIFDTIQIDGLGAKEIIFERHYEGEIRDIKQASQTEENRIIHKYEIWNIDTKTLLFQAVSYYEYRFENWMLDAPRVTIDTIDTIDTNDDNGWSRGFCSYTCDFSIDSVGKIKISLIKTTSTTNVPCTSDKKEGFYIFKNGQYIKE